MMRLPRKSCWCDREPKDGTAVRGDSAFRPSIKKEITYGTYTGQATSPANRTRKLRGTCDGGGTRRPDRPPHRDLRLRRRLGQRPRCLDDGACPTRSQPPDDDGGARCRTAYLRGD